VQDVLNTVKTSQKGPVATLELELSEEVLKKLGTLIQGMFGPLGVNP
jgi:hypothetical protein